VASSEFIAMAARERTRSWPIADEQARLLGNPKLVESPASGMPPAQAALAWLMPKRHNRDSENRAPRKREGNLGALERDLSRNSSRTRQAVPRRKKLVPWKCFSGTRRKKKERKETG